LSDLNQNAASSLKIADKSTVAGESLDSRVRSLKIAKSDRIANQGGIAWFPWSLSILLAALSGWLLLRDPNLSQFLGQQASDSTVSTIADPAKSGSNASRSRTAIESNESAAQDALGDSSSSDSSRSASANDPVGKNTLVLEARGYVIAKHQVLVSPQVSGRILKLNIEEGRLVEKGDILAQVDETEYRADLEQMRGTLMRSQAELAELEAGARPQELASSTADLQEQEEIIKQFESQFVRLKEALKSNSVSLAEFEVAQSSFYSTKRRIEKLRQSLDMMREGPRKERIDVARAAVIQAEANFSKSQWRLDNCTIRAPISGTILKKNAEEGNLVNPIAFNGSFSVCDIADLSDLEIDLNIQERDVSKVFAGQTCEVRSEAYPKRVYKATVSRLMPIADRAKGAIPVRVAVRVPENEEGIYLKPEMSAVVVFYGGPAL